ncbi:EpsG family protein [Pseudoalteromonas sp. T1lg23B]|uniref:EpsG family protein n=1 Tax=Pseudoalteromonas sp. T1lg23B TaxID=2077097 RepID=UPI001319EDED|nr:EpsG family protein [Pseudoalteromonas sp. T1lg23B]
MDNIDERTLSMFFYIALTGVGLSTAITAFSYPIFLYEEQDFTTYYNNYVYFLEHGFSYDGFVFGLGLEIALPFFNYILSCLYGGSYPYLVKLSYALTQVVILISLIFFIGRSLKLSLRELAVLSALTFIFFKHGATLNHLRQGYSSFFILFALFSTGRNQKFVFLTIASIFHLSALPIYFLLRYLFSIDSINKCFKVIFTSSIVAIIGFISFSVILTYMLGYDAFLLAKFKSAFAKLDGVGFYFDSFKVAFIASVYLLVLIFMSVLFRVKNSLIYSLITIYVITLTFSYVPGLTTRVFASVFTILTGYLYFLFFYKYCNFKQRHMFFIVILFTLSSNWILGSSSFYYNFPIFNHKPLYYLDDLFIEQGYVTRANLPSIQNIKINNPHR